MQSYQDRGGVYDGLEDVYEDQKRDLNSIKSFILKKKTRQLPYPWEKHYNEEYQSEYFFNVESGETSWDFPSIEALTSTSHCHEEPLNNDNAGGLFNDPKDDGNEHQSDMLESENVCTDFDEQDFVDQRTSIISGMSKIPRPQTVVERSNSMLRLKQEKEYALRCILEQKKLEEMQSAPVITKTGKSVQRNISDMLAWEEKRKAKLQALASERLAQEEALVTGKPVVSRTADMLSRKWRRDDAQSASQNDDERSVGSGSLGQPQVYQGPQVAGMTMTKPVEQRMQEYEERKKLRQQKALEQQYALARSTAVPSVSTHSMNLERRGDVAERLYSLAAAQALQKEEQEEAVRSVQHDMRTGQKLFQPKLNPTSERIVSRSRPPVPVEVLLNHKGQVYKQKVLERERRLDSRAQQLSETASRMNPVSERLVQKRLQQEGAGDRLSKGIGRVKQSTLAGIEEPTFRPNIHNNYYNNNQAANSHAHSYASDRTQPPAGMHFRKSDDSSRHQSWREESAEGQEEEEDEYDAADDYGAYYDERMVYGDHQDQHAYPQEHSVVGPFSPDGEEAFDYDAYYSTASSALDITDLEARLYDPSKGGLQPFSGSQNNGGRSRSSSGAGSASMYSRSKQWDEDRRRRLERERESLEQQQQKECSFRPKVDGSGRPRGTSGASIAARQSAWAQNREQKLEAERQRALEEEMRDCSFAPRSANHQPAKLAKTEKEDKGKRPPPPPRPSRGATQHSADVSRESDGNSPKKCVWQQQENEVNASAVRVPLPLKSRGSGVEDGYSSTNVRWGELDDSESSVGFRGAVPLPVKSGGVPNSSGSISHTVATRGYETDSRVAAPSYSSDQQHREWDFDDRHNIHDGYLEKQRRYVNKEHGLYTAQPNQWEVEDYQQMASDYHSGRPTSEKQYNSRDRAFDDFEEPVDLYYDEM